MSKPEVLREDIRRDVRDFVLSEDLGGEDPTALEDDTPLITSGIIDSIASVRLVTYFEERFGITFDAQDVTVEHLDTVSRMVDIIDRKMGEKNGRSPHQSDT